MPRSLRCLIRLLVVVAVGAVLLGVMRRLRQANPGSEESPGWAPLDPMGAPSQEEAATEPSIGTRPPRPARPEAVATPWVAPTDGTCPDSHPVKAKLSSKIFHLPGGANYRRTKADRCYLDPATAEADGLRRSKV